MIYLVPLLYIKVNKIHLFLRQLKCVNKIWKCNIFFNNVRINLSVHFLKSIFNSISRQVKFYNPPVIVAKRKNRADQERKSTNILWAQFSLFTTIRSPTKTTNRPRKETFSPGEILFFRFTLFEALPFRNRDHGSHPSISIKMRKKFVHVAPGAFFSFL